MCNALMSFATYQLLHCISQSQHDAQGFIIYTNIAVAQQHKHRPSLKPQLCNFKRRARTQCDFSQHGVHGQWGSAPVRWCACNLHQHSENNNKRNHLFMCDLVQKWQDPASALPFGYGGMDVTVENASTSDIITKTVQVVFARLVFQGSCQSW